MKRYVCAVLAVILALPVFAGCGIKLAAPIETIAPEPTVVGVWSTQVDMTDKVNQLVYEQTGAATVSVGFPLVLMLSLQQDGTYTLDVDRTQLEEQIDILGNVLWQIVLEQAAGSVYLMPQETAKLMQEQGKSKELLMQQLDIGSMFDNAICGSGAWKQEESKLYFAADMDGLSAADGYDTVLTDKELKLTYAKIPAEDGQELTQETITFTKMP